ncbi:MAG: AAA family ATPase [Candidatus Omnitrophica bacterium]|nr:AAA family ATPase [Candidatus Omnitrophota bacterium]MBU1128684.1 AAA family ATPase [Candidatus Omnitrophota bacterium]MBU1784114.1 AAA family ATPase [Candidatus Omnitrophota bacterium]MBU1850844.1 AAA family ATPase [Candidatus Omnitrophota bacterium]
MLTRVLKMRLRENKVKILIGFIVLALLVLTIVGLNSLESFYRKMTLATMPLQFLMAGIHAGIFVFMYLTFMRGGFAKLDKAPIKGKDVSISWTDVIGMQDAKQEALEVVQLIKDSANVRRMGGSVVKGLLMLGPPGCGKTYLAKAIATEADMPFISMSGSEFVEVFVGVGASRVRKLFKKARNLAYGYGGCIIFIDEIDAIGRSRTFSFMGGQETNSTLNQVLAEMDGLKGKEENIVVIGATNAQEEHMDTALLRPGRFDRKIMITKPSQEDREELFKFYLTKVKAGDNLDVGRLARRAVGKSPADIANIVKESALIATRNKRTTIDLKSLSEAFERVDLGIKHRMTVTPKEKEMTAYHETGHLMITYLKAPSKSVFKASIIPRRGTLGVVWSPEREELHSKNKEQLSSEIMIALGGYVAEKIKFNTTTSGVSSDFTKAMLLAHAMVWALGMGDSGYVGDYTAIPKEELSEEVKIALNKDTSTLIQQCTEEAQKTLEADRPILDRFAKELLAREELEYDEIIAIFAEYGHKETGEHQWSLSDDKTTDNNTKNDV